MIEPKDPTIKGQEESGSAGALIYSNTYQNKAINALTQTSTRNYTQDALTRDFITHKDGVTITFRGLENFRFEAPSLQVFVFLVSTVSQQITHGETRADVLDRQRVINIPVKDYMQARGLKDYKGAVEQLRQEINTLRGLFLEWRDPPNKKGVARVHSVPFIGAVTTEENPKDPIKWGRIKISVDLDMARELAKMPLMPYPARMFEINTKINPNSWYLIFKLCTLHNMNFGKPNANTTSVKTLIEACPNLREIRDGKEGRNNYKTRETLERDLNAITDGGQQPQLLKEWYYIADGKPLTEEQANDHSVKEWLKLSIHYELLDYPDQTPRIEAAKAAAKKAKAKRRRTRPKQAEEEQPAPPVHDTNTTPPPVDLPKKTPADKGKGSGAKS